MSEQAKTILVVLRKPPYAGQTAKEALDAVLTAAAFEQPLTVLFMDDGVYQLLPAQDTHALGVKSQSTMLPALPMYDVENICVDADSLAQRGISHEQLVVNAEPVDSAAVRELFHQHQQILSF